MTEEELNKIIKRFQYEPDLLVNLVANKDLFYKITACWSKKQKEAMWRWVVDGDEQFEIAIDMKVTRQAVQGLCARAKQKALKKAKEMEVSYEC